MQWCAMAFPALRSWLAEFYAALAAPRGTLLSLSADQLQMLPAMLDDQLKCIRPLQGIPVSLNWRLCSVGSAISPCKSLLPSLAAPAGRTWTRWHDPNGKYVAIRPPLQALASSIARTLEARPWSAPLHAPPRLPGLAAADACAAGTNIGIGGWFTLHDAMPCKTQVWWFAEHFEVKDFPPAWSMREDAQKDIACYELLAQIALLWARAQFSHPARVQVCLPSMSDNTSAEAVANKLFTTSLPLNFSPQNYHSGQ